MSTAYRPRLADGLIRSLLSEHPAIMVNGPRASGKTTTARRVTGGVARLDVEAEAAVFRADPDAALRAFSGRPLLIDEWQEVPGVIGAVKRAVDGGAGPGSFVLTGSVRGAADADAWPGTGRVVELHLGPLTVCEREGALAAPGLLGHVGRGFPTGPIADAPNLVDYIDLALGGGFPEPALTLSEEARERWYATYVEQIARRDALTLLRRGDPDRLRSYIQAYALNSAGVADRTTLFTAAGINRKTADGYEATLRRLFVVESVPAWSTNRLSQLVSMPKRYVVDVALMAAAAGLTRDHFLRDGDLLGRALDTFVYSQVRAELADQPHARLHHLRTARGRQEVDLVIELGARRVAGLEVKAASAPQPHDARHLAWLRDRLGDDFVIGVVLHTGPSVYGLGDRIVAAPICMLWRDPCRGAGRPGRPAGDGLPQHRHPLRRRVPGPPVSRSADL